MKRKFICLCIAIFGIFLVCLAPSAYASIVNEEIDLCSNCDSFNLARGTLSYSPLDLNDYDHYNEYISKYIESGYIESYIEGSCQDDDITFKEIVEFFEEELVRVKYYFNDTLFFDAITEGGCASIELDNEIYLGDIYLNYDALFVKNNYHYNLDNLVFKDSYDERSIVDYVDDFAFKYLGVLTVKENEKYKDSDCHIVMPYNQLLELDEILSSIKVNDYSNEYTLKVDYTNYDITTATISTYNLRVVAFDNHYHYTIQDVYIDVVDVIRPNIRQIKPIIFDYPKELTKEDLIEYFEIEDYSNYTYDIDFSSYQNALGDYSLTITVKDEYDNENSLDFNVSIIDSKSPTIGHLQTVLQSNLEYLDYDQLKAKALLSVMDNCDGDLSSEVVYIDLDDYQNNYQTPGQYRIELDVSDKEGNEASSVITILVVDDDYPEIEIDKYLIVTKKGEALSKEDVINLFKALGYDLEDEDIQGDVFNLTSLDGEYEFNYSIEDKEKEGLVVTNSDGIDYQMVIPTNNQTVHNDINLTLILILSISSFLVVSSLVLGFVLYKKKH